MQNRIIIGNCLESLKRIEDNSIQSIVTSPPYWGLRNYGIEPTIWGGDANCQHQWDLQPPRRVRNESDVSNGTKQKTNKGSIHNLHETQKCKLCGAWLGVLGDEPTPKLFVDHFSLITKELWRVLKDDGTFWLNLGDTYAEKSLVGVPWRVALRLKDDGWYLRQDIIWAKPNPMPESVKDRCTKAHEYIFLLTKNSRYYYDYEAIKEKAILSDNRPSEMERHPEYREKVRSKYDNEKDYGSCGTSFPGHSGIYKADGSLMNPDGKRNKRSVWSIPTAQYAKAHFAVFPEKLPTICILAGSKQGDIILDPFGGAGTTGLVAQRLNRKFVLIEQSPKFAQLGHERIFSEQPLFSKIIVE